MGLISCPQSTGLFILWVLLAVLRDEESVKKKLK